MKLLKIECSGCGSNDFADLGRDLIKCKHCGSIYRLNYSDADVELMKHRDAYNKQQAFNYDLQLRDSALQLYKRMSADRWFSFERLQRKYGATEEEIDYLVRSRYLEASNRIPGFRPKTVYRK